MPRWKVVVPAFALLMLMVSTASSQMQFVRALDDGSDSLGQHIIRTSDGGFNRTVTESVAKSLIAIPPQEACAFEKAILEPSGDQAGAVPGSISCLSVLSEFMTQIPLYAIRVPSGDQLGL